MGILNDGTCIAVKRLDNLGQEMKEFVAEVQTIGSIHHLNLCPTAKNFWLRHWPKPIHACNKQRRTTQFLKSRSPQGLDAHDPPELDII
ncbi:G-type lectin S-receptor-like serine/threonine-protein kinase SD2-5 [Nymphaea thermarum]|nr:G-type lectin S-receptor-like serine/threonine-protein kinase SD2-5 [Nymphaea thermarum]